MKSPFLLALLLVAACSPANIASPDGGTGAASACSDYAYARCSRLQACSSTAIQLRYGDFPTCQAIYKANCLGAIEAPSTGASSASAEACAQAAPGWSCPEFLFNQNAPPACAIMAGGLSNGATCAFPAQCRSAFCAVPIGQACGACAPPAQAGDSCANLTTCGPSLACAAVTSTCTAFAAVGAACQAGQPCASGLACVGAKAGTPGTCTPAATTPGASCTFGGAGCDVFAGLACNAETNQCATARIVGAGLACGIVANQAAYCAAGGACVAGACVPGARSGEPCDLANGPGCLDLLRCVVTSDGGTSGTCQPPSAALCR